MPDVNRVGLVSKDESQTNWRTCGRVEDGKGSVAVTCVGAPSNDVEESKVVRISGFPVSWVVIVLRDVSLYANSLLIEIMS